MASLENHTCWTQHLSRWIRGIIARAYIVIAGGSPCVVPSVDAISPFPGMIIVMVLCMCQTGSGQVKDRRLWCYKVFEDLSHCMNIGFTPAKDCLFNVPWLLYTLKLPRLQWASHLGTCLGGWGRKQLKAIRVDVGCAYPATHRC